MVPGVLSTLWSPAQLLLAEEIGALAVEDDLVAIWAWRPIHLPPRLAGAERATAYAPISSTSWSWAGDRSMPRTPETILYHLVTSGVCPGSSGALYAAAISQLAWEHFFSRIYLKQLSEGSIW